MLSIGSKGKAVVLANGTVSCITQSNQAVKRGLIAAAQQGHVGVTVKNVVLREITDEITPIKPKTLLQWVVVCDKDGITPETVCDTRSHARYVRKFDKEMGYPSYIERREYRLITSKKVS